jgi:formate hydrogenlyase transcriptional activator
LDEPLANPTLGPVDGRSAKELALLLRLHQAVSGQRDCAAVLGAARKAIEGTTPAERLVVAIADSPDRGDAAGGLDGGSLLAWVIAQRRARAVSSPDEIRDAFPATHRALLAEQMRSLLALPLESQDRCFGAMAALASTPGAWDDGASRPLFDEIARTLAAALDNCLEYERVEAMSRELGALLDVNRAIGRHLGRDELFGALAKCLRSIVPTDRFGIELPIEGDRLQGHLLTPRGAAAEPTRPTVLPALGTACHWVLENREWLITSSCNELRERFPVTHEVMQKERMESLCALPLVTAERARGVLFFMAGRAGAYAHLRRGLLEQVASAVAVALDDCLAHEEVATLRDRLAAENVYLQEEIAQEHNFHEIIGRSAALREVLSRVEVVAPTPATVLVLGETGTGKELVARAIHDRSTRRERPLVKVNCAAITAGLVESELFGHVKGAFTGAGGERVGRFELADGGTIFLDEIGELPLDTQAKLLRVLQEREFEPVGSSETRKVDVRLIAATNRDLARAVEEGRFRSDLYFRLNVVPITVPPLRERREDVPLLLLAFADRYARELGKRIERISPETLRRASAYAWPGNVRELSNFVERAVVLAGGPVLEIEPELMPEPTPERAVPEPRASAQEAATLDGALRRHLEGVLAETGWVIDGPHGAARLLGLRPSTLRSRLQKLGIRRPGS